MLKSSMIYISGISPRQSVECLCARILGSWFTDKLIGSGTEDNIYSLQMWSGNGLVLKMLDQKQRKWSKTGRMIMTNASTIWGTNYTEHLSWSTAISIKRGLTCSWRASGCSHSQNTSDAFTHKPWALWDTELASGCLVTRRGSYVFWGVRGRGDVFRVARWN